MSLIAKTFIGFKRHLIATSLQSLAYTSRYGLLQDIIIPGGGEDGGNPVKMFLVL